MRENMVSKKLYDDLQNEYNRIIQELANGKIPDNNKPTEKEQKEQFENNIKTVLDMSKSLRPLKLFKNLIEVDDYLQSKGERTIFAPSTGDIDDATMKSCERMKDLLQSAIDQSDGSDEVALAYIGNHLVDQVGITRRR